MLVHELVHLCIYFHCDYPLFGFRGARSHFLVFKQNLMKIGQ
jgi:hypothetical protein